MPSELNKKAKWISSSFDGFGDFGLDSTTASQKGTASISSTYSKKRPRQTLTAHSDSASSIHSMKAKREIESEIWADIHKPKTQGELAVHKKKIAEVETWLHQHSPGGSTRGKSSPILLLTGPAGAGKTATIHVLCNEIGLEIHEWINPVTSTFEPSTSRRHHDFIPIGGFTSESQQTLFQDFLLRANRYNTLQIFDNSSGLTKKIILVEDMPNVFFRDSYSFHDILRKYSATGRCPLVFIVSDSFGGESAIRDLFPKDLQQSIGVENISFNPVAPTSLMKTLTKISQNEANQGHKTFTMPSKDTLEELVSVSAGDIRGAINALQFTCLQDPSVASYFASIAKPSFTKKKSFSGKPQKSLPTAKRKDSRHKDESGSHGNMPAIGGRDHSMFLFRALGKILYCKRDPKEEDKPALPPHLARHERDPLNFVPEDVVERTHLSSEYFTSYLHQNYLDFYTDIEDIVDASHYLSDADHLTIDWASRSSLREYSSCVAARGVIHCNSARGRSGSTSGGGGWKPLHKPQWFEVNRKYRDGALTAKHLFSGHCWTPTDLQTQLLPYLALINVPLNNPGQISFIQEVCKFTRHPTRTWHEKLDEKDVGSLKEDNDDDNVVLPAAANKNTEEEGIGQSDFTTPGGPSGDEEIIIEDFDD
ncbi:cell cycle checkpoint protein RAD17-like [Glandiceps talaboti]